VDVDDPALKKPKGLDGDDSGTHPMARIGRGADAIIPSLDMIEDRLGLGIFGRLGVVMDGDADVVFLKDALNKSAGAGSRVFNNINDIPERTSCIR